MGWLSEILLGLLFAVFAAASVRMARAAFFLLAALALRFIPDRPAGARSLTKPRQRG
jgi:hypothetical protein